MRPSFPADSGADCCGGEVVDGAKNKRSAK
jgi:hypothetical protein